MSNGPDRRDLTADYMIKDRNWYMINIVLFGCYDKISEKRD